MTAISTAIDSGVADTTPDLRVAFFSDSLPERNGTGAYYHDLLAHLAPRVGAVEVISLRRAGDGPTCRSHCPAIPRSGWYCPIRSGYAGP